jgi:hypothetical protein
MDTAHGVFIVPLGIVIALLGLNRLQSPGLPGHGVATLLLGVLAIAVGVYDGSQVQAVIGAAASPYVVWGMGPGLYVIGAGGLLVALVSLFGRTTG